MKDPDVQLIRFYHGVIKDDIKRYSSAIHKECLKKLKPLYNTEDAKISYFTLSSFLPASRYALVYHRGPCLTSTLVDHFRKLLKSKPLMFQTILLRGTFTICCLTTGLATDFVAMVIVLEEKLRSYIPVSSSHTKRIMVEAVVVSSNLFWNATMSKMVEKLPQLVNMSNLNLRIRFLYTDFTKSLTDDVKEALTQSDFVTMTHFLSSIHKDANSLQVIQEIIPFIKKGSLLFFMDSPGFHLCDIINRVIGTSEHMTSIYGPINYDIHRLSFLCMKECLKLYSKYYGWRYCTLESRNYVCSWYKRTTNQSSSNAISFSRLINDPSLFH